MVKKRHILLVNSNIPHCFHGGGGVTAYSIGRAVLQRGYRLTILALASERGGMNQFESHINHWQSLGAECIILNNLKSWHVWRNWQSLDMHSRIFPSKKMRSRLEEVALRLQGDLLLLYHWEAVAAAWGIKSIPKVACVGDPVHLPQIFREQFYQFDRLTTNKLQSCYARFKSKIVCSLQKQGMVSMLNECKISGAFAAHHARLLRDLGIPQIRYFRTPVPDPEIKTKPRISKVLRILHIGHLQGIATLTGIQLLVEGILPKLLEKIPSDHLQIHLVGGNFQSVPSELKDKLKHKCILIKGQITPPDEEFSKADILIVPTPIELGIRVRIITGLSFGVPIVAHTANKAGIPELTHGENCLLASDATRLAEACLQIYGDLHLQQLLRTNSRAAYERFFSVKSAGNTIVNALEEACSL